MVKLSGEKKYTDIMYCVSLQTKKLGLREAEMRNLVKELIPQVKIIY